LSTIPVLFPGIDDLSLVNIIARGLDCLWNDLAAFAAKRANMQSFSVSI